MEYYLYFFENKTYYRLKNTLHLENEIHLKCTLCKGHLKKELHKEDGLCVEQGVSSISSIDINISLYGFDYTPTKH
jgi:hypothetical protein